MLYANQHVPSVAPSARWLVSHRAVEYVATLEKLGAAAAEPGSVAEVRVVPSS